MKTGMDMYVFRDGRKRFAGAELLERLRRSLERLRDDAGEDAALRALIAAGELECGLRDAAEADPEWMHAAEKAERITDVAAASLVNGSREGLREAIEERATLRVPETLVISVLEGFAFYALHPAKFLGVLREQRFGRNTAVIGVRSIGAPLSAVVAAALGKVERITVRPTGHPYERELQLTPRFREFVDRHRGEEFIIVDEGPGLSGSSFLSVAEALEKCGVAPERITMMGSRAPHVESLRTPNALERWPRFRFLATDEAPKLPAGAVEAIGGGWWRRIFLKDFEHQPASWTQLEMSKYLSADRKRFYKFEGFGHFGEEIGERAKTLERCGFGAPYLGNEEGFGVYEVLPGELLRASDLSEELIARMAKYCAMRGREFVTKAREDSKLREMLRWNWQCEFGDELGEIELPVERLVVADARMMPSEWLRSGDRFVKLDACTHGDDHFFPGACDIAWDVAGAIVEWKMDAAQQERFVALYERESGDQVRDRLPAYVLAYGVFRMGWSKMAAHASVGEFDQQLLERDYQRYREAVEREQRLALRA